MSDFRILIVEDEQTIVEFLRIGLRYEGFDTVSVDSGEKCLEFLKRDKVDLVILDIMLPDIDGFEVCRRVRSLGIDTPILMLTAKKDVEDRVEGLNAGADDYVTKPFSFDELLARIRAILRRFGGLGKTNEVAGGGIVLNMETRDVFVHGERIYLTPKEFSLLEMLMKHPRRVFTREELLESVFGYNYSGGTNIVDVHISHLRDKIGDKPPKLIKTHYGVGYAFHPEEEV
ncbi:response regulator transcription factor [Hippea alviniae]|uniref:response regulator transcription factor n=1 Tax=Hippea alviniae TaxID=1279027 RepID=UPI0003B6AE56|nr:response regulator transcription factor [Hippea alviniae]